MSRAARLEIVTGKNWSELTSSPLAVLMLARSDCPACREWTEELTEFLKQNHEWTGVRFGKINLDLPEAEAFKKASEEWLDKVEGVPFNILYVHGTPKTSFLGAGVARLENRLRAIRSEKGSS